MRFLLQHLVGRNLTAASVKEWSKTKAALSVSKAKQCARATDLKHEINIRPGYVDRFSFL